MLMLRKETGKSGIKVCAYNPSYSRDRDKRIMSLRPAQAKLVRPYLRNVTQVIEPLPLGIILSTRERETDR
jgi:hypothetical protein